MRSKIIVGIPTMGRANVLRETLRQLALQTRLPDAVIICGTSPQDLDDAESAYLGASLIVSEPGASRQRNVILEAGIDNDIVVFLDDDFFADPGYIAAIEKYMADDRQIVVATGLVIADGITGPGISAEAARSLLASQSQLSFGLRPAFSGYGCNMAVRVAPIRQHGIMFDERLPLYSWQEDVDLSCRLSSFGTIMQIDAARGVHLGVKLARSSGVRLGYSQVANPIYLTRKRLGYPLKHALPQIARNVGMNIMRVFNPEAYVDRRGRLRGNLVALLDLIMGRMVPERILDL